MARRLHCFVRRNEENVITDTEWEEIRKLQHWYSSEFIWTAGKPGMKMYAVFPNLDHPLADNDLLMEFISERWKQLRNEGLPENVILRTMRDEKLILLKEGGYHDGCLLSGSVRVANNEWNAYLFTEFIVKSSLLAKQATFEVHDEGEFIRWRPIYVKDGCVYLYVRSQQQFRRAEVIVKNNTLFAKIDPREYDDHPSYQTQIAGFRKMERDKKMNVLKNWNWHGYESEVHEFTNEEQMYDLNQKIREFSVRLV